MLAGRAGVAPTLVPNVAVLPPMNITLPPMNLEELLQQKPPAIFSVAQIDQMSARDLRNRCGSLGLSKNGTKIVLADRLKKHLRKKKQLK